MKCYTECRPIIPYHTTAWLVTYESGRKRLFLFDPSLIIEEIVKYINSYSNENFTAETIDMGDFEIDKVNYTYSHDTRKINQDMEIE